MKTKVSIIMMSHLSDVQCRCGMDVSHVLTSNRVEFVKYLILKYPDTTTEVDADVEYEQFISKHPSKKII